MHTINVVISSIQPRLSIEDVIWISYFKWIKIAIAMISGLINYLALTIHTLCRY